MVETRSTSNNTVPKMSTSSSDSPDGAMLTQQSIGTSTATKSNEQKRLETSKLMIENDIKLHTDYLIAAIDSSEDIETLEETVNEIREMQQKLEPVVIDLISGLEPDEQDIMSREHSRLKIEIKQTLTLFRKHVKETKRPLQQTSSGGLSLNSNENIETHDNTLSHLQQRRTHFVFDDTLSTDHTTQSNSSAPAEISRFVSYGYTAPGGTTLPVNNTSFTSNCKMSAAPCSASQQSFSTFPCGFTSTDSNSLGQNNSFPLTQPSFSNIPNTSVTQMSFAPIHSASISTCFQNSVPKLHADHFDGDPISWMKWYSIFQATFDRAPMTSSEKMIHLQSLLTGEAKALVDGYGCNGDLYASALHRLQEHFGNPKRIVNAFLEKLNRFKSPKLSHPESYTQFSSFLLTMVDTFQQLGFVHDLHSTNNLNVALAKLPNPVRLEWNKFVLEKEPSLQILSDWLLNYSKTCRDLYSSLQTFQSSHAQSSWKISPSVQNYTSATSGWKTNQYKQSNSSSSRNLTVEGRQPPVKLCPSNEICQFLYKCTHFQALPASIRREHIRKLRLCFNCFRNHHVEKCTSKNVCRSHNCGMKHHTLLHDSFAIKSGSKKSNVKTLNLQGTGQVAVVPVQLKNGDEVLDTYANLDNGSCQSLLLRSTATNLNLNMNTIGKMPISGYHMTKEIDCAPVKLQIRPLQGEQSFEQIDVVAVLDLNMSPVDTKKLNCLCDSFEHLNHICFPDIRGQ